MKRASLLLAAVLALAAAAHAMADLRASVVDFETAGDGGFWVVLDNGSELERALLVHLSAAGEVIEERWIAVDDGWLQPSLLALDTAGRVWVPVGLAAEPDGARLRVYDADGSVAAEAPLDGRFLGLSGGAGLVLDEREEPPRVLLLDPFTGGEEVVVRLRREEYGPPDGGCIVMPRRLVPAAGGAVYFLDAGSPRTLVRRYEPPGVPAGDWSAETSTWTWPVAASHGDDLYLAFPGEVVRLSPSSARLAWEVAGDVDALAADGDGAWALLDGGSRVLRLHADGSTGVPVALDPPPPGITYAERREALALADGEGGEPPTAEQLVEIYLLAGGERAATARRALVGLGTEAVDAVVAAGERWNWDEPLARLAVDLLLADPVAVGERMAELVALAVADGTLDPVQQLPMLLVHHWPEPSPRFLLLLEDHVSADGSPLFALACGAYAGEFVPWIDTPDAGPPGERFPAPLWLIERQLADLEREEPPLYATSALLAAQFHRAADAVESRLRQPADPARPRLLEVLSGLPALLDETAGRYGAAEAELARRARRWAESPHPEVAAIGALLAVATGDAEPVPDLLALASGDESLQVPAGHALVALLQRLPAEREPEVGADLVHRLLLAPPRVAAGGLSGFVRAAPPAVLGAAVRAMADPDVPCGNRSALSGLLLAEETWPRVPTPDLAALAASGHPVKPLCSDDDFRFLDALWRRLGGEPDLRRALEERFDLAVARQPLRRNGLPPAWLAVLRQAPADGLGRRVPDLLLRALVAEPAPADRAERWVRVLGAAAEARGAWPGFAAWLDREIDARPEAAGWLPDGAAERWLGRQRVEELLVDGETTWSREGRQRPAGH